VTAYSSSRDELLRLLDNLSDPFALHYQFELSWSQSNIELKSEIFNAGNYLTYQQVANIILADLGSRNISEAFSQKDLWKLGISGDFPVIVVKIKSQNDLGLAYETLEAYAYLNFKGIKCDLVLLNLISEGYIQKIKDQLEHWIKAKHLNTRMEKPNGVYIRSKGQFSEQDLNNLLSFASFVVEGPAESLSDICDSKFGEEYSLTQVTPLKLCEHVSFEMNELDNISLPISSSVGFDAEGKFVGIFSKGSLPKTPWSNVIANDKVGFLATETGAGFSWAINSREFRITPWSNDPVKNSFSESFYIRDIETDEVASPWLILRGDDGQVKTTYSANSSNWKRKFRFFETSLSRTLIPDGIKLELDLKKYQARDLEIFWYIEPVLGVDYYETNKYIQTEFYPDFNSFVLRNAFSDEFRNTCLIIWFNRSVECFTCSQREFIGLYGSTASPWIFRAFRPGAEVSMSTNARPTDQTCLAVKFKSSVQEERFTLTIAQFVVEWDVKDRFLASLVAEPESFLAELRFDDTVSSVRLETAEKSLDVLASGWLLQQTVSCRIHGRSGFYQSGGAYGFRDQLQDSLALLYVKPEMTKKQILLHASRQFIEGDVQHWWHPPSGKGTRTRFSDDFLWLPYSVIRYIKATGDHSILNERVDYIKGPSLAHDQHEVYIVPEAANVKESLYEHCKKAIMNGFKYGDYGLPLIGIGDWNDGFSEVGINGKGQSVWLGWFQAWIFDKFADIATSFGDISFAEDLKTQSKMLVEAIENYAWDGQWYIRAFFDNGTPIGSSRCKECKIDSLTQSWSALTGFGDNSRISVALESCLTHLVDRSNRIIKLLTPPFENTHPSPGYIQGYLPGIRENGAQYTHAAMWVLIALAEAGNRDLAFELFQMINPINIYLTELNAEEKYCAEPYVFCGDVYSNIQVAGRGGWSWYTGSSGWAFQLIMRYFLGIDVQDGNIVFVLPPVRSLGRIQMKYHSSLIVIETEEDGFQSEQVIVEVNGRVYDNRISFEHLKTGNLSVHVKWLT
ncbi:MAG: hypothetical protein NZO16_01115, partial [Deltaproteobacteria bacterium]|nr:hypothetical protein [Deltaproteobacteria bacterium]